jgi:hypothetical protein
LQRSVELRDRPLGAALRRVEDISKLLFEQGTGA